MIKVGILISYDYNYVFDCIKQLYQYVDEIYLAIDKNRLTWQGNSYKLSDDFFVEINKVDLDKKIIIYEDDFYISSNTTIQNETRERRLLSERMGEGWMIQLDSDEYAYDFDKITKYLKEIYYLSKIGNSFPITIFGKWITLFKRTNGGFLYIENNEPCPFVFNTKKFDVARKIIDSKKIYIDFNIIHQSWARSEEEIKQKIENWGHNKDFDTNAFFDFWKDLDETNYKNYKNFHPLDKTTWNELKYIECQNIEDFLNKYSKMNPQRVINHFTLRDRISLLLRDILMVKNKL